MSKHKDDKFYVISNSASVIDGKLYSLPNSKYECIKKDDIEWAEYSYVLPQTFTSHAIASNLAKLLTNGKATRRVNKVDSLRQHIMKIHKIVRNI